MTQGKAERPKRGYDSYAPEERARILLKVARGQPIEAIARAHDRTRAGLRKMVNVWRHRGETAISAGMRRAPGEPEKEYQARKRQADAEIGRLRASLNGQAAEPARKVPAQGPSMTVEIRCANVPIWSGAVPADVWAQILSMVTQKQ